MSRAIGKTGIAAMMLAFTLVLTGVGSSRAQAPEPSWQMRLAGDLLVPREEFAARCGAPFEKWLFAEETMARTLLQDRAFRQSFVSWKPSAPDAEPFDAIRCCLTALDSLEMRYHGGLYEALAALVHEHCAEREAYFHPDAIDYRLGKRRHYRFAADSNDPFVVGIVADFFRDDLAASEIDGEGCCYLLDATAMVAWLDEKGRSDHQPDEAVTRPGSDDEAWSKRLAGNLIVPRDDFGERCGANFEAWLYAEPDDALALLSEPDFRENEFIGGFRYTINAMREGSLPCCTTALDEIAQKYNGPNAHILSALVYRHCRERSFSTEQEPDIAYQLALWRQLRAAANSRDPVVSGLLAESLTMELGDLRRIRAAACCTLIDLSNAVTWLQKQADRGLGAAHGGLWIAYGFGLGVTADRERAEIERTRYRQWKEDLSDERQGN